MEAKEALKQIKSLLFANQEEASQEEVQVEFAEGVLSDGTIVKFDKLEAGGMISVVTAEGEVPAPVGEHELEDGTIVVVSEPGIIAEVKMVEQDDNEIEVETEMSSDEDEKEEESAEVKEEVVAEPQVDKFAEISESFNAKFAEVEAKIEFLNDISKRLVEFMEAYAKVESVEETQAPKNAFFSHTKNSKQDAYKRLQNVFQNLKN